jgi:hypothetical protein
MLLLKRRSGTFFVAIYNLAAAFYFPKKLQGASRSAPGRKKGGYHINIQDGKQLPASGVPGLSWTTRAMLDPLWPPRLQPQPRNYTMITSQLP